MMTPSKHHLSDRLMSKWRDELSALPTILLLPDTHTTIHACGVGQHQPMDGLIGANEDDYIIECLLDVDSSRQQCAVGELEFNSIVE